MSKPGSVRRSGPKRSSKSSRKISRPVETMLWGRAAGRCEFAGCNRPLWTSLVTSSTLNVAQKAHIYSFSPDGPRGHTGVAQDDINGVENLMLLCHQCHEEIDEKKDGGLYTVAVLREMKDAHERRVENVSSIAADRKSHILIYGANIGEQRLLPTYQHAAEAVFPTHYPAERTPILLSTINSTFTDRDTTFWNTEGENLARKLRNGLGERLALGEVTHLSVFAIAPQALLILLGTLLGDITPVSVYQRHREPTTWAWPPRENSPPFEVREHRAAGSPALVLSLSATVTPDRIYSVLGEDASIYTVTVQAPHNDLVKSPVQLSEFRSAMRPLLDRIKANHGQQAPLHIFPAAPVSLAVELGRIRMPKADMPWRIYDQVNALGGFVPALPIPFGENP